MKLQEIKSLMQNVQAGDQLYFHCTYALSERIFSQMTFIIDSGHGEQVKCVVSDPTEDDGMDECMYVPHFALLCKFTHHCL